MLEFFVENWRAVAIFWGFFLIVALIFNYCASTVSGNHLDPHRDDGQ